MSALIFAPDLDPFALLSKPDYRIVQSRRFEHALQCNNPAQTINANPGHPGPLFHLTA